jgi:hypothetical protein
MYISLDYILKRAIISWELNPFANHKENLLSLCGEISLDMGNAQNYDVLAVDNAVCHFGIPSVASNLVAKRHLDKLGRSGCSHSNMIAV